MASVTNWDVWIQYGRNGLNDVALQTSQIHVSLQVLVFGKRLYTTEECMIIASSQWVMRRLVCQLGLNRALSSAGTPF